MSPTTPDTDHLPRFRDLATNSLRYWEPRRILYNTILAVIVLSVFATHWTQFWENAEWVAGLNLFILAVIANILYCSAYVADVFAQLSAFRETWRRSRWILLLIGIVVASSVAYQISLAFVNAPPGPHVHTASPATPTPKP
jgi:hypothetical protein